jgi:hypothetical protein
MDLHPRDAQSHQRKRRKIETVWAVVESKKKRRSRGKRQPSTLLFASLDWHNSTFYSRLVRAAKDRSVDFFLASISQQLPAGATLRGGISACDAS